MSHADPKFDLIVVSRAMLQDDLPMLVIDRSMGVLLQNAAARQVLAHAAPLLVREGTLTCSLAADRDALMQAMRSLELQDSPLQRRAVRVGRTPAALSLLVSVLEPGESIGLPGAGRLFLVVLHTANQQLPAADPLMLAESFSLTPAEARVAVRLAEGKVVKEIAQEHQIAVATVRSQVKAIFQKTGVRRQADLVRLLVGMQPWAVRRNAMSGD